MNFHRAPFALTYSLLSGTLNVIFRMTGHMNIYSMWRMCWLELNLLNKLLTVIKRQRRSLEEHPLTFMSETLTQMNFGITSIWWRCLVSIEQIEGAWNKMKDVLLIWRADEISFSICCDKKRHIVYSCKDLWSQRFTPVTYYGRSRVFYRNYGSYVDHVMMDHVMIPYLMSL